MRRILGARPRRALAVGLLLGTCVFSLYALTAGKFVGYEDETVAVAEGLVKTGQLVVMPGTPLTTQGVPGPGGRRYSRTGLTQPLLEAPFYAVGEGLDQLASHQREYTWRLFMLRLFDPLMAALTVMAIFAILIHRRTSLRLALGIGVLAAVGSLIWPYAKMGMETTAMGCFSLALLAAVWAAEGSSWRWAISGLMAGATAAALGFAPVLLVALIPFLFERCRSIERGELVRRIVCFGIPLLLWALAIGWYNAYRTGSVTNFDDAYFPQPGSIPWATLGLSVSPGKGLLIYSPLAILGLSGLRWLWREDRPLAAAVIAGVVANLMVIVVKLGWSDETWGPRYLVPSAWLLLLPLAAWVRARTRRRWRLLFAVAAISICIQIAAVFSPYWVGQEMSTRYAGGIVYYAPPTQSPVAYGDDGPRWVPGASPLLFSAEVALAWVKQQLTGSGFVVGYGPVRGHHATFDLRDPARATQAKLPDFWWSFGGIGPAEKVAAVLLALLGLAAGLVLTRTRMVGADRGGVPVELPESLKERAQAIASGSG